MKFKKIFLLQRAAQNKKKASVFNVLSPYLETKAFGGTL
jgi:hypothetical protein